MTISRQVKQTKKDKDGDILALCNKGAWWSPKEKEDAVKDINGKTIRYYVKSGSKEVDVHVVIDKKKGKYLRTDPDKTTSNNLDDLPDC